MAKRPVIAIAGLACETSTFTPSRTLAPAFHPKRGQEAIDRYAAFIGPDTPLGEAADFRGALIGHALPGGQVTRPAFEELADEIVDRLEKIVADVGRLDGLWYDIHGAMCVEGMIDMEATLLRRIRTVIGPNVLVSASMDLHGNVSRELIHQTDLITCYRTGALQTKSKEKRQREVLADEQSKPRMWMWQKHDNELATTFLHSSTGNQNFNRPRRFSPLLCDRTKHGYLSRSFFLASRPPRATNLQDTSTRQFLV